MTRADRIQYVCYALQKFGGEATYSRLSVELVPVAMSDERFSKALSEALAAGFAERVGDGRRGEGPIYQLTAKGQGT